MNNKRILDLYKRQLNHVLSVYSEGFKFKLKLKNDPIGMCLTKRVDNIIISDYTYDSLLISVSFDNDSKSRPLLVIDEDKIYFPKPNINDIVIFEEDSKAHLACQIYEYLYTLTGGTIRETRLFS